MLRVLVLLLVLVNLGLVAWQQGLLQDALGVGPQAQREPERLSLQVRPESVRVLSDQAAPSAAAMPTVSAPAQAASVPASDAPGSVLPESTPQSVAPAASTASGL